MAIEFGMDYTQTSSGEKDTILLYGDTGDGKTPMIGEYAEADFIRTGKITRLYAGDPGGWRTIIPHVRLGIIRVVPVRDLPFPWEWVDTISKGKLPVAVPNQPNPKWIVDKAENDRTGTYAFEGMTAFADILMQDAAREAAAGRNIGGQPPAFKLQQGETKWAGNSQSHYGNVQTVMQMAIQESLRLPGNVIWTAMAKRASDADLNSPILGPQLVGKAVTSDIPRWFVFTFRLMAIPGNDLTGKKAEHRIYFDDHEERNTSGAKGLGNLRMPLDAFDADAAGNDKNIPPYISPASIMEGIRLWREGAHRATNTLLARVTAARPTAREELNIKAV